MQTFTVRNPEKIQTKHKGKAYTDYRRLWALAGQRNHTGRTPLHLDFDTQDGCNLKCSICHLRGYKRTGEKLDLEHACSIIREGAEKDTRSVNIGAMGEPFLDNKGLFKILTCASESGLLDMMMHSNMLLATDNSLEELIKIGLTQINISADAITSETYAKIRGGDFDCLVDRVRTLADLKIKLHSDYPIIRISAVPCHTNYHELGGFFDFWAPYADIVEIQHYRYEKSHGKKALSFTKNHTESLQYKCSAPWKRLMFWPHGPATACCSLRGLNDTLIVGDIKDNLSLEDIWTGQKLTKIRSCLEAEDWSTLKVCRSCISSIRKWNP